MGAAGSARARESAPRVATRCARTARPRGTRARCARSCPRRSLYAGARAATRASALAAASSSNGAPAVTTWSAAAATRSAGSALALCQRGARARSLAGNARPRRARALPSSGSVPSSLPPCDASLARFSQAPCCSRRTSCAQACARRSRRCWRGRARRSWRPRSSCSAWRNSPSHAPACVQCHPGWPSTEWAGYRHVA